MHTKIADKLVDQYNLDQILTAQENTHGYRKMGLVAYAVVVRCFVLVLALLHCIFSEHSNGQLKVIKIIVENLS